MSFLGDLRDGVDRLAQFAELDCDTDKLVAGVGCLSDASVRDAFSAVAGLAREVQKLEVVLAGVIAKRSARATGHAGLAQVEGYRTPVQMVQEITGVPRGEAIRVVKVGATLVQTADASAGPDSDASPDGAPGDASTAPALPWHEPLGSALLAGRVTRAHVDVIRRGLGEPPCIDGQTEADISEVWRVAAAQLIDEASRCSVEDLAASARAVRDAIDPAGAEARWTEHYEARSFRVRIDADGRKHGHIVFDDATYAFWQSVLDAALRPRRGGPRFMTDEERAAATQLADDARTNDQIAYDLVTDVFRAGTLADAKDVFGTRQAGVRLVTIHDSASNPDGTVRRDVFGRLLAVAHTEDGSVTLPGAVLDRALCDTGTVSVTVDSCGNPLDVGREYRLFTPAQRIALAARDGGCMWPGCERPTSMTEAHHIDHWHADHGATDIDRGILLCSYHHLHLHVRGWKIVRNGKGAFRLIPPPGEINGVGGSGAGGSGGAGSGGGDGGCRTDAGGSDMPDGVELRSRSPLRWMFDPPPRTPWRVAA